MPKKSFFKKPLRAVLASNFFQWPVSFFIMLYLWFVFFTTRWTRDIHTKTLDVMHLYKPAIHISWHGRILILLPAWKKKFWRIKAVVSLHRDGSFLEKTLNMFQIDTIRGSTSRGAFSAIKNIFKALHKNDSIFITPDGPRGPCYQWQSNAIQIASKSQKPIILMTYSTQYRKHLPSWDNMLVPLPFGRGILIYSEPIYVPRNLTDQESANLQQTFEDRLNTMTQKADQNWERAI